MTRGQGSWSKGGACGGEYAVRLGVLVGERSTDLGSPRRESPRIHMFRPQRTIRTHGQTNNHSNLGSGDRLAYISREGLSDGAWFCFFFAPPCARVAFGVLRVAVLFFFSRSVGVVAPFADVVRL